MDWAKDGHTWPLNDASRFVDTRSHRWHIQEMGQDGPVVLLLHGSGASTHSWRAVIPDLATDHRVIALDLPGHGFSACRLKHRIALAPMAEDILALLKAEGMHPDIIVGHSAGAAVALRMTSAFESHNMPHIITVNAAVSEFQGLAGVLFPAIARVLAINPLTATVFSRTTGRSKVRNLINNTGSELSDEGYEYYARLVADRHHVDGALTMMANWRLAPLIAALPSLNARVRMLVGEKDTAVPPDTSTKAAAQMGDAAVQSHPLGHLLHEEAPEIVAAAVRDINRSTSPGSVQAP